MSAKKIIGSTIVAFLLTAGAAGAQTSTVSTTTDEVGVPNTGAGGSAAGNILVLGSTAAVALAGLGYLSRRKLLG